MIACLQKSKDLMISKLKLPMVSSLKLQKKELPGLMQEKLSIRQAQLHCLTLIMWQIIQLLVNLDLHAVLQRSAQINFIAAELLKHQLQQVLTTLVLLNSQEDATLKHQLPSLIQLETHGLTPVVQARSLPPPLLPLLLFT